MVIDDQQTDRTDLALNDREYDLLSRLFSITVWLAKYPRRSQVVAQIKEEFGLSEPEAEVWIQKAEDMMALGVLDSVDEHRKLYHIQLNRLFGVVMNHLVKDQVEVTTKPMSLKIILQDGTPTGKFDQVNGTITKIKPQALDVGAANFLMKVSREMAHITGARPISPRIGARVGTLNVQINQGELPSAQVTDQLSNDQLAALMGAEVVEVLPGNIIDAQPAGQAEGQADPPEDPGSA